MNNTNPVYDRERHERTIAARNAAGSGYCNTDEMQAEVQRGKMDANDLIAYQRDLGLQVAADQHDDMLDFLGCVGID